MTDARVPELDLDSLPKWLRKTLTTKAEPAQAPSVTDHRGAEAWPLLVEAATVSSFLPRELAPDAQFGARGEAEKIVLHFAELTHDPQGTKWALTRDARRAVIEASDPSDLKRAAQRTASRFADPLSHALRDCLTGDATRTGDADLRTLEARRIAVTWLRDMKQLKLPQVAELDREIELRRLLGRFERMIGETPARAQSARPNLFFGRDEQLEQLRKFVAGIESRSVLESVQRAYNATFSKKRSLNVWGIGGVGKTTLIAKFMLEHVRAAASRFPFAYLDFDRSTISARNRPGLLMEMCHQVGSQFAELTQPMAQLASRIGETTRHIAPGSNDDSTGVLHPFALEFRKLVDELLNRLESRFEVARPFLLVFDTFEVVQYGPDQVFELEKLVRVFSSDDAVWPRLRVIISGRRQVEEFLGEPIDMRLGALDRKGSIAMLRALAAEAGKPVNEKEAARLIDGIVKSVAEPKAKGVQPLRLRLIGEVFNDRKNPSTGPEIVTSLLEELKQPVSEDGLAGAILVDGILVRRILGHVADDRVRALADPGLVVRRINAEVIRKVMTRGTPDPKKSAPDALDSEEIVPWDVSIDDAADIFAAFQNEVSLVEPDGNDLRHRQDVRREMLPLIRGRRPNRFRELHRLAFEFFRDKAVADPRDHASAAEAIYHGLWVGEPLENIDALWPHDSAFDPRIDAEEFDAKSPADVYVRAKTRARVEVEEIVYLPRALALAWLRANPNTLLRNRRLNATIDVIRRVAGEEFEELDLNVAAVVARLLYRAGLWRQAMVLVRRHLPEPIERPKRGLDAAPELSLMRIRATIAARSGASPAELMRATPVAFSAEDPLVRVELFAYAVLGLRHVDYVAAIHTQMLEQLREVIQTVPRSRWVHDPLALRLAILADPDAVDLLGVYVELTEHLPRDVRVHELVQEIIRLMVLPDEVLRDGEVVDLDDLWRLVKNYLSVSHVVPQLRTIVAFDHSDWTQAFGNALTREMASFTTVVALLGERLPEAKRAVKRGDGPSLVQAAADAGVLLELAEYVVRVSPDPGKEWVYPETAGEIASALLRWHRNTMSAEGSTPALA